MGPLYIYYTWRPHRQQQKYKCNNITIHTYTIMMLLLFIGIYNLCPFNCKFFPCLIECVRFSSYISIHQCMYVYLYTSHTLCTRAHIHKGKRRIGATTTTIRTHKINHNNLFYLNHRRFGDKSQFVMETCSINTKIK